jgi:hypothetical protein
MRARLVSAALILAVVAFAEEARAEPVLGLDAHGALAFKSGVKPAVGGTVLGGYNLDLEPILLQPELAVGVEGYPGDGFLAFRGMGGIRAGFAGPVEPTLFLHLGYGFLKGLHSGPFSTIMHAFAIDTGISVDYRPTRSFTVGGTLGYEGLVGKDSLHGIYLGPRVAFWFK